MHKYWKNLKIIKDDVNIFSTLYQYDTGEQFYIEPVFYTQLTNLLTLLPQNEEKILHKIEQLVKKNKYVIFTLDFEQPLTKAEGYVYLEITDVTDPLGIYVEDKSRGSDYGD